jgi:hypothetical protein
MKKIVLICSLVLTYTISSAQNLIVDPSFEEFVGDCYPFYLHEPIFNTDFDSAQPTTYCGLKNWIRISYSPDVYSNNAFGDNITGYTCLPSNQFHCKYVYPHSDSSCVGGVQYFKGPPRRELIEGKIVTSLIEGHSYKFSIWAQLFDTIYHQDGQVGKIVGINSFSAYFS